MWHINELAILMHRHSLLDDFLGSGRILRQTPSNSVTGNREDLDTILVQPKREDDSLN